MASVIRIFCILETMRDRSWTQPAGCWLIWGTFIGSCHRLILVWNISRWGSSIWRFNRSRWIMGRRFCSSRVTCYWPVNKKETKSKGWVIWGRWRSASGRWRCCWFLAIGKVMLTVTDRPQRLVCLHFAYIFFGALYTSQGVPPPKEWVAPISWE